MAGENISTWRLVLNIINVMEGIGFVALPYAIHQGGIAVLIGLAVVPLMMLYTSNLLVDCLEVQEDNSEARERYKTYQEVGMACWSPLKHIIWGLLTVLLFIILSSMIVLSSSLMSQQFPNVPISEAQWACLGAAVVFPTVFLKQLSHMAWISLLAAIALVSSAGIALSYEFQKAAEWNFSSLLFWDTRGVFLGLSIVIVSYLIQTNVITMAADVSDLSRFKKALIWSYFLMTCFKIVFALPGFLTFTNNTSEIIFKNLPLGIPVQVIVTFFALNVLLAYPLFTLTLLKNVEELTVYQKLTKKVPFRICYVMLRVLIVLGSLGFAVGIPHFALVSALMGSFVFFIALTLPALFYLRLKHNKISALQILVNVILVVLGIGCTVFGLSTTIMSLAAVMKN